MNRTTRYVAVMSEVSTAHFFSDQPINQIPLSQLLGNESHFVDVPSDWHVVVTDIKGSTAALGEGRHNEVNLIATGSIIATLNLAHRANVLVPFFFGGDGATMIVPGGLLDPVIGALTTHRENTLKNFGLDLRVGSVPVADLYAAGHELKISRLYISDIFSIPVLLGHGLSEAERVIKGNDYTGPDPAIGNDILDLSGMECRWDKIEPEVTSHEVVSLLVSTRKDQRQAPVFKRVVDLIDDIYGSLQARTPISVSRLKLKGTAGKITLEMRTKLGRFSLLYLVYNWILTQVGRFFFFQSKDGKRYLHQLVELSDTLVIDGRINTVIAGTSDQRRQLEAGLVRMEDEGLITYGLFVSGESVMSCYVTNRTDKHIHFVDGSNGGYTRAATVLKGKRFREDPDSHTTLQAAG